MKKLTIPMVMMLLMWSIWGTFAWGWGFSSFFGTNNFSSTKSDSLNKFISTQVDTYAHQINQRRKKIEDKINQRRKKIEDKINQRREAMKKQMKQREKIAVQETVDKAKIKWKKLQIIKDLSTTPVTNQALKTVVQNQLSNVVTQSVSGVNSSVVNTLWWINSLKEFKLTAKFDPNKVVTFNDIKNLYLSNFVVDQKLLWCDHPDDAVKGLCWNITNLINSLTWKQLTINDIYRLQLYSATISKAIFYEGTLAKYKAWAVVLWINKQNNTLKSIDIVRNYTSYNTADNDLLPFVANEVDINITNTVPIINPNNLEIVLWLNGWSVRWIRISPTDSNLSVPGATSYKVMTIKWWKNGCSDNKYTDSIWYGPWQIGLSHNWENLEPSGTKGVELNLSERCYKVFDSNK